MEQQDRWSALSMKDKASLIKLFVNGGILSLDDMRDYYNEYAKGGSIHINPENKGKFNATKKRTGKTTEELTHSKNPLTRKRAIFAQNAKKWSHADGGLINIYDGETEDSQLMQNQEGKQKAIINNNKEKTYRTPQNATLIKDLAYKIGASPQVASRGYSGPGNILSAMLHLNKSIPFDDNKYAFLYGTERRFPEVEEPVQGFNYTNYLNKNYRKSKRDKIKNVYGIINPEDEYFIDPRYTGLVKELAKHNYHFYDNADELSLDMDVDNSKYKYRDDVGNFIHQFGLDEGGNPVMHDSDVYDFLPKDYNYGDDSALVRGLVKAEAKLFNAAGTPYIIRHEYQPIRFGDPTRFSAGINEHLENMSEEDIAKATGTGFIEPVYITEDGSAPVIEQKIQRKKGKRK